MVIDSSVLIREPADKPEIPVCEFRLTAIGFHNCPFPPVGCQLVDNPQRLMSENGLFRVVSSMWRRTSQLPILQLES